MDRVNNKQCGSCRHWAKWYPGSKLGECRHPTSAVKHIGLWGFVGKNDRACLEYEEAEEDN
jgi:hypothetical protein